MKKIILVLAASALLAIAVLGFAAFQSSSAKPPVSGIVTPATSVPAGLPKISLDISNAGPRQVEDSTVKSIMIGYGRAWHDMTEALEQNRASLLPGSFVGVAQQKLANQIAAQQRSGLSTRIIDHGHKLQAVFYSPEGSAMQLRDTAQYELQVLDGSSVVSQQNVTVNYIALMTVAEDRWKVRVLQATE